MKLFFSTASLIRFITECGLHRTSLEIALDLIYAATGLQYPPDKIILGIPSPVDVRPEIEVDPNTFVQAIDIFDVFDDRNTLPGDDGFLYRRIPLSLLTPLKDITFEKPTTFPCTTYQILNQLNAKLNAQLTENDVMDDVYASAGTGLRIRANPKSLVWLEEIFMPYDEILYGRLLENSDLRATENDSVRIVES